MSLKFSESHSPRWLRRLDAVARDTVPVAGLPLDEKLAICFELSELALDQLELRARESRCSTSEILRRCDQAIDHLAASD